MTDRPFSVAALAAHWGVSSTFIYDLIHSGRLEAMRFGGKLFRITPAAVAAFEAGAIIERPQKPAGEAPDMRNVARLVRVAGTR